MAEIKTRPVLLIRNEADAWDVLEKINAGHIFPDDLQIKFDGWPTYNLDVKGRDWQSSLPTRVMGPLLEIQRDLYRAYATLQYGEPNLRRLKAEERDDFELVVQVAPGSSLLKVELDQKLNELARAVIEKMGPNHVLASVITIALVTGGVVINKDWVAQRAEEKRSEVSVHLSQEETKRLEIFAEAIHQRPELKEIREDALTSQSRILKSLHPDDSVYTKGVELKGSTANEIAQPEREYAHDIHLFGVYRILGNRTDKSAGFRIRLENIADNTALNADAPKELPHGQLNILRDAEWGKSLVYVDISASMLRGNISDAIITSARIPTKEEMANVRE